MPDDVWLYVAAVFGVALVALTILFMMERVKRKTLPEAAAKEVAGKTLDRWPVTVIKTVTNNVVKEHMDKLRILEIEREILSYAIRRLYEAQAEGKISEEERDRLMLKYREDLARIKEEISRGESIIALSELERMQEEFVRLFSERFEELNKRIRELRGLSGLPPPEPEKPSAEERKEEKAPIKKEREVSKPKAVPTKPEKAEPEKTEAEKKIEQIMAEVEKVLERLGQMEVEE